MKTPCKACVNYGKVAKGHRVFVKCMDEESAKGFKYDHFSYDHRCENQKVKEICLTCEKYEKPYCESVYAECEKE